jgi:hypothetical protein
MKALIRFSLFIHIGITGLFVAASLLLIAIGATTAFEAVWKDGLHPAAAQGVIESLGLVAVAIVALQIARTVAEEEVIRQAHVSAPTRVRRFLSRFMVVIVVALAIEGLVATFKALHEDMGMLPHAASIMIGVGAILSGWGLFVWLNRAAEELEPEAMQQAKEEDQKLD